MNTGRGYASFVVRPHRSLSVGGIIWLFAVLGALELSIGVGFALMGAWMVLPFAGLEIGIVGALCVWFYRHLNDREVVVIESERVRVIKRIGVHETQDEFPRYWARVTLDRGQDEQQPSRLCIGSHGRFVRLAEHINEVERQQLARELRQALRPSV